MVPLLVAGCSGGVGGATSSQADACNAALAYLETKGPGIVVTANPEQFDTLKADAVSKQFTGAPVPIALLGRLFAGKGKSALTACPALGRKLTSQGIPHERDGRPHAIERVGPDHESYGTEIVGVSLPVVSDDGSIALLGASSVSGTEAGGGEIVRLRRTLGGGWQIVDRAETWIS